MKTSISALFIATLAITGCRQLPSDIGKAEAHMVHLYSNSAEILGAEITLTTAAGKTVNAKFSPNVPKGYEGKAVYPHNEYVIIHNAPDLTKGFTLTVKTAAHTDTVQVSRGNNVLEMIYLYTNGERTIQMGGETFQL